MRPSDIPSYFIYGEPARPLDVGFVHVETVQARRTVHEGRVAPHRHDHMGQITYWTKGSGCYRIEDAVLDFRAPAVSFVPSNVVHGFDIEANADALVVSISDDLLGALAAWTVLPLATPTFLTHGGGQAAWRRLAMTLDALTEEYQDHAPAQDLALASLVSLALTHIARLGAAPGQPGLPPGRLALASAFRQLLGQHFRDNWPVEAYVRALRTTRHLLDKAVHEALGKAVKAAIEDRRLLEAQRLVLFTRRPVEDIAYELGFKDPGYFSRVFRKRLGQPPGQWREAETARRVARRG